MSIESKIISPVSVKNDDTHRIMSPIINNMSQTEISHPIRIRRGMESQFGIIFKNEYPLALQRNPRKIG